MGIGEQLAKRTITGLMWAYTVFFGGRLATLATTTILARILVPADFGVVGFALLFLNFIDATQDFGIKAALVYNDEQQRETADTAFWMNAGIGLLQFGAAFLLAPLALQFIDDERIVTMLRIMALVFIINALGNTHDALLQKQLKHRRRYLPSLYSAFIKGIVSVILALAGAGVWSLVAGHVVGAVVRTIAKWLLIDWGPRFRFFPGRARMLWNYGAYILAFNVLGIALDQADQLMIGTLLGEVQLGYYSIAARIPEMVIANFSLVLTAVLFPAYSRLKNDASALSEGVLLTTKYTGFVTIPAGFGLAAVAPELVLVFFGDQWGAAVPLLRVLAFLGMVTTLPWSVGDAFKAIGRPDLTTKLLLVEALYSFPLIWVLAYGTREAVWASTANLIAVIITAILRLGLATYYLPMTPRMFVNIFYAPMIAALSMFGAVMAWRNLVSSLPPVVILLTAVLVGGIVYAALIWLMERKDIVEKYHFLQTMIRDREQEDEHEFDDMRTEGLDESAVVEA